MAHALTPEEKVARAERKQEERNQDRKRDRVPMSIPRTKLSVAMDVPGYHLHWINDTPGRVLEAEQGGYEFVTPEEVGSADAENSRVRKLVGKNDDGSALYAFLMKIRLEWYEEDQKKIQEGVDTFERAIKSGKLDPSGGLGNNGYSPKGGISIK